MGQELEASPAVTHGAIDRVLARQARYDELPDTAQAVVRAAWDEHMSARISGLSFEDRLRDSGIPWIEGDSDGNPVVHDAPPALA
jgi:hypothetical protein